MPQVEPPPKLKLPRLRDIGWTLWDPIGLMGPEQKWDDPECQSFAYEYDGYLIEAAGRLRRGEAAEDVVEYLIQAESEHMGLGLLRDAKERATRVVMAIDTAPDLWTFPPGWSAHSD